MMYYSTVRPGIVRPGIVANILTIPTRRLYNGPHTVRSTEYIREYRIDGHTCKDTTAEEDEIQQQCYHGTDGQQKSPTYRSVYTLQPLQQTLQQYLFGVTDIRNDENVKRDLVHLSAIPTDAFPQQRNTHKLISCAEHIRLLSNPFESAKSLAMESKFLINTWKYLGVSTVLNRPIVLLPTSKHYTRQIGRYYGLAACMALGVTPVQIGDNSLGGFPYLFEDMPDFFPVADAKGNDFLICSHSCDKHVEVYDRFRYIHNLLEVDRGFPELIFITELEEYFAEQKMDLAQGKQRYCHDDLINIDLKQVHDNTTDTLLSQVGNNRVIYVSEEARAGLQLNCALYDKKRGLSKVTRASDGRPVLLVQLNKHGGKVFPWEPNCVENDGSELSLDVAQAYGLQSFIDGQRIVAERLGLSHAVVSGEEIDIFKTVFNSRHVQDILK